MSKMRFKYLLLASALAVVVPYAAQAAVINLNFEGINGTYPSGYAFINDFYNGGTSSDGTSGPNYGIHFPGNAQAICLNTIGTTCSNTSRGGVGDPNSQLGGLFFLSGTNTFLDDPAGFDTGFSFNYTAISTGGSIDVFDGLGGTGTNLAHLNLPTTASGPCIGYSAGFCPFFPVGVAFAGIGKSIVFNGAANQIVFDDITFGSITPGPGPGGVPEPATLALFGAGLAGLAGLRRRRKAKS